MKMCNSSLAVIVLISLVVCSAFFQIASGAESPLSSPPLASPPSTSGFCASKCDYRCSRNWRKNFCVKLCMTCCGKCKCVPSGPFADKGECPCYRDMKNDKGKSKCP